MRVLVSTITNFRPDLLEIQMSLVYKLKNPEDDVHYIVGSQSKDPKVVGYILDLCKEFKADCAILESHE